MAVASTGISVPLAGEAATFGPTGAATNVNITVKYSASNYANLAMVGAAGSYSTSSLVGDTVIRNIGGNLILQTGTGTSAIRITTSNNVEIRNILSTTGNVGIGIATPIAPLQFATVVASRKIVLWASVDNDHQFYGFGVNAGTLRYQVPATGDAHIFYAATSSTASNELFRITGGGNVGIGTSSPSSLLHVSGTSAAITLRAAAESQSVILYLCTPFNASSVNKTAIISSGISSWSRSNLNFCVNTAADNTTAVSLADARLTINTSGNVVISSLTASRAVFANSSKELVTRPGFSYQLWNASATTGVPNNTWTIINNLFNVVNGGDGFLNLWAGSLASFRNDTGVTMLYVCTFTCKPVGTGISSWAMRIDCAGDTISATEVSAGRNEICITATGQIGPNQAINCLVNQYTGFGQNAEGVRIAITTYPLL
jgi:hypothetical protein